MTHDAHTARMAARMADLLMKDEQVLIAAQRHWLSYGKAIFLLVLTLAAAFFLLSLPAPAQGRVDTLSPLLRFITLVLALLTLGQFIYTAVVNWTMVMLVTSRRVFLRTGLIARDIVDLPLIKLDAVNLDQGVIDRIFGCGNILMRTMGEVTTTFPAIKQPTVLRNVVVQALETAQNRRNTAS